ncbi:tetratricopeptide repeat protein [Shewanella woodyi]|uniref:tetratricopeptide repeat protein n=1 Tax=Shewanella woodyi TaxID=60961 RepID=UPI0037479194
MLKIFICKLLFMLSLSIGLATAKADENVLKVESLTIKPEGFTTPFEFKVTLPKKYSAGNSKPYFVLFDLHPRSQAYLGGLHDWLSHNGGWPWLETIVVTQANYHKDFASMFQSFMKEPDNSQILDVLAQIMNKIDSTYNTNGFRIYSGFVSNGALGLHAMLNRPEIFNAYIIASPSLSDDFGKVTSTATEKLKGLNDRLRFLYLTISEHDTKKNNIEGVKSFEESLKASAPSELEWTVKYDTEHYYMTLPVIAVLNGIEALFDDYHKGLAPDSEVSSQGPDAIIEYYKTLSNKKYGFEVSAERSLRDLAKSMLESKPDEAIAIYKKVIGIYPDSAYALSSLAKAYEKLNDLESAVTYQTQAFDKANEKLSGWHQRKMKRTLDEMKNKLSD